MTRDFVRPVMIGALSILAGTAAQVSPASAQLFWDWGGGQESNGAGREVVRHLSTLGARRIAYVACDPAALARDLAFFRDGGYRPSSLRAFDLFPMTHHLECVAILESQG